MSPPAMDVNVLNTRLRQVEKAGQKVTERIGDFQAKDDKEAFRVYIEDIKTVLDTFRDLSFDLRSELKPEDTNEKVSIDTLTMAEPNLQKLLRTMLFKSQKLLFSSLNRVKPLALSQL